MQRRLLSGLIEKQFLFSNDQLLDSCQIINHAFEAGCELTREGEAGLSGIRDQIEDILPNVKERIAAIQQKAFDAMDAMQVSPCKAAPFFQSLSNQKMKTPESRRAGANKRLHSPAFFIFGEEYNMLVYYRRNKRTAAYDPDQLQTVSRPEPPSRSADSLRAAETAPTSHGFQSQFHYQGCD